MMRVLGIDLAWGLGSADSPANETGVVAVDPDGTVVSACWTRTLEKLTAWIEKWSTPNTLAMIDAPLVVNNPSGQRPCECQVGRRYGRWKVSANSTNLGSKAHAGRDLLEVLKREGWSYSAGWDGPPTAGRSVSECYPYTTLVGSEHFGFALERPTYKRKPRGISTAEWPRVRNTACDGVTARLRALATATPRLDICSHEETKKLCDPSPLDRREYKHREDLIDAVICAWTGLLWCHHGHDFCQILGERTTGEDATIIAPALPSQRRRQDRTQLGALDADT